ncbi:MAG: hypothetical protein RIB60_05290 [Phycisphaerales bacterium]
MGRETPWEDEYTLLCERCGYVVEGLDPAGNCPECGKPIAESLPERRVGTAWQRSPSLGSAALTGIQTLLTPISTLNRMQPEVGLPKRRLLSKYALLAALGVPIPPLVGAFIAMTVYGAGDWGIAGQFLAMVLVMGGLIAAAVTFTAVFILTSIESRGLRFIASRRNFRLTPAHAVAITSHAGIGWVLAFPSASAAVVGMIFSLAIAGVDSIAVVLIGSAGFLAGFLFFETFAWLGLRRCKFANRARPPAERS